MVDCPSCGQSNSGLARFCSECGAELVEASPCPHCGQPNRPTARFCNACGHRLEPEEAGREPEPRSYTPPHLAEKILRNRGRLEGERRTVTVLFADAEGFTPISERVDEEDVYDLMQGCVSRMMDAVHRYEGTVTQFTGDGVIALFGAPIAHEDAARRAVSAALEMQQSLDEYSADVKRRHPIIECRFRVGLNTGPVVVGKISDDLDMDYTALGDTVNLASRMEELAEPGSVYLTESTYRAVQDYIECQPLGALEVKGKTKPVNTYRALGEKAARTRFEVASERGLTPLVGRAQELSVLRGYLDRARQGQGQVVFVSGEAGIGKSRLVLQEFGRDVADDDARWLVGLCISYGKSIPYLPIIDVIKHTFGIQESDDDETIMRRVDEAVRTWDDAARATAPYLKYLLNVDPGDAAVATMDPSVRRAAILDALRALLLEESKQRPLVVVVEDLHWIDEKSEEALAALVDVVASTPVLLILTYRPAYAHSLGERTYYSRIALGNLPPEESAVMAGRVLDVAALPGELEGLIIEKAEGNPFYIEEVAKNLVETGVLRRSNGTYLLERPAQDVRIPDTIQEVILARIDRLEREAKEAIQLASVIGREFTVRLLSRISHVEQELTELLGELKALELIREKAYFPELAYMFKHALTHDVAYSTLLMDRRRSLHRTVAAAIEDLYADRLPEQYEALAHHYHEGQEWEKALDYLTKAGDKATAAYANQDALDYYAKALDVCERLGDGALETVSHVARNRAFVNFVVGDMPAAIADFELMLTAAHRAGDRSLEGMALAYRGMTEVEAHDFDEAEATERRALAIGQEIGDDEVTFAALVGLAEVLYITNRLEEANAVASASGELAPDVPDPFTVGYWGLFHAISANWAGRFDEALDRLQGFWRPVGDRMVAIYVMNTWCEALALGGMGEYSRALQILHDVIAGCERIGELQVRARALNTVGWIYGELQDHPAAIEWNTRGLEAAIEQHRPDPEFENNARLNLGDSLMALGRLDEAEEQFQIVERVARDPRPQDRWQLWRYSQHLYHSYGELWLTRGDSDKAMSYADDCLALAEESNSRKNIVKGRRLRAQVAMARGELENAERELSTAIAVTIDVGNPPQVWKTYAAIGDLRRAQGRDKDAKQAYRDALGVIENVARDLADESLRATFLTSPHVEEIRSKANLA